MKPFHKDNSVNNDYFLLKTSNVDVGVFHLTLYHLYFPSFLNTFNIENCVVKFGLVSGYAWAAAVFGAVELHDTLTIDTHCQLLEGH